MKSRVALTHAQIVRLFRMRPELVPYWPWLLCDVLRPSEVRSLRWENVCFGPVITPPAPPLPEVEIDGLDLI